MTKKEIHNYRITFETEYQMTDEMAEEIMSILRLHHITSGEISHSEVKEWQKQ